MTLIILQAVFAWFDDHLTRGKVIDVSGRPNDFSFSEHPIWLIDTALSLLTAYLWPRYEFDSSSAMGISTAMVSIIVVLAILNIWRRMGVKIGDHCSHEGVVTTAGWIHGIFFVVMLWIFAQVYLGLTIPMVPTAQLIWLSIFFTIFFPLGVVKFSPRWRWDRMAVYQTVGLVTGVWSMTGIQFYLNK